MSLQEYDERAQHAAAAAVTALENNAGMVARSPYTPSRLDYFASRIAAALIVNEGAGSNEHVANVVNFSVYMANELIAKIDSPKTE